MAVLKTILFHTYNKQQEKLFLDDTTAAKKWNEEYDATTAKYDEDNSGIEIVADNVRHKVTIDSHPYWHAKQHAGTNLKRVTYHATMFHILEIINLTESLQW